MGKRSNFERRERDFWPTPFAAVVPLIPHLGIVRNFTEPCAGDGTLIRHLSHFNLYAYFASDIEPMGEGIHKADAMSLTLPLDRADSVITNPPWDRKILHPMISHFIEHNNNVWLLFDADWMHTKQATPYLKNCEKIVSIGRVKWVPDSKQTGKDNCCWYKFVQSQTRTEFVGR